MGDLNLQGGASPNNEAVWRELNRVRMKILPPRRYASDQDAPEEIIALLTFKGDDFVPEQIRRMVGTALAVAHGWLPSNIFNISTHADVFLETPVAPPGRLYFAEAWFPWPEVRITGKGMFEDSTTVSANTP